MKILIVDDDADSLRLLKVNLTWGGHDVVEAKDGQSGWEKWSADHHRLVITDWMMPDVPGPDLIRRIRATDYPQYTYIIMLTALGAKPNVVTGLEAGADDYLTKPFYPDELLERVAIGERIVKLEERLHESRRQMEYLANHDSLTGLLNRRAIQERAEMELNRADRRREPLGLVLLDIDHFKAINDQYGHQVGDQTLCLMAKLLSDLLRPYDAIGRWGGEEFLIVLPGTDIDQAVAVGERMRASVAGAHLPLADGTQLRIHVSLGVTCACDGLAGSMALDELIHRADEALYKAKGAGRNQVQALACACE